MLRSIGLSSRRSALFACWQIKRPHAGVHALEPLRAYRAGHNSPFHRPIRPRIIPSQKKEEGKPPIPPPTQPTQPIPPPTPEERNLIIQAEAQAGSLQPAVSDPGEKPIPLEFIEELKRTKIELPKPSQVSCTHQCITCDG